MTTLLFALACIITVETGGGAAAIPGMVKSFLIGVISGIAISSVMALMNGESVPDAMLKGLADGVFWGGVFAFVSASVNAIKAGIRGVKNARLPNDPSPGEATPQSTCGGNKCFKEGTLVETEGGLKPIEEIEVGDKVLAYNEETGEQAYKEVVRLFRNETKEWYHVHVNGEEIICTGGHPFYVQGKGFVPAKDLTLKDKLTLSDGTCAIIEEIKVEQLKTPETTYNFEVADFHTYYVSKSKVLTHNKCWEWGKGSYDSVEDSLIDHALRHGESLGLDPNDAAGYFKKATNFADTVVQRGVKAGRFIDGVTSGIYEYRYLGKYIHMDKVNKIIVSFGLIT